MSGFHVLPGMMRTGYKIPTEIDIQSERALYNILEPRSSVGSSVKKRCEVSVSGAGMDEDRLRRREEGCHQDGKAADLVALPESGPDSLGWPNPSCFKVSVGRGHPVESEIWPRNQERCFRTDAQGAPLVLQARRRGGHLLGLSFVGFGMGLGLRPSHPT